mgnify:CR=1 FL=1
MKNVHIKFKHILQKEIARWLDPGCRLIRKRNLWRVVSGHNMRRDPQLTAQEREKMENLLETRALHNQPARGIVHDT